MGPSLRVGSLPVAGRPRRDFHVPHDERCDRGGCPFLRRGVGVRCGANGTPFRLTPSALMPSRSPPIAAVSTIITAVRYITTLYIKGLIVHPSDLRLARISPMAEGPPPCASHPGFTPLRCRGGMQEVATELDTAHEPIGSLLSCDLQVTDSLLVSAPCAGAVTGCLGIGPERQDIDAAIGLLRGDVDGAHDAAGGAMPGRRIPRAALDGANDLVGDVLVNIEAFFSWSFPFARGPRDCGLVGQKGPGPLGEGSNAAPQGAPRCGAELHKQSAEASRVDPEAGPVICPT